MAQVQPLTADEYAQRGLDEFMQEKYAEAAADFAEACRLAPQANPDWDEMRARAESNAANRFQDGLTTIPFTKAELLAPPALALREPAGLSPMPPPPALARRLLARVQKLAGVIATPLFDFIVRINAGDGTKDSWRWPREQDFLRRDAGLAAIRNYMNHNTLQDPYGGQLVGNQQPGQKRPQWTERFRTATGAWNTDNPMEGAAGSRFIWQGNTVGRRSDTTLDAPNPLAVANELLRWDGQGPRKEVPFLNVLAVAWIQFMVHDWVNHRGAADGGEIRVPFPPDDPRARKYGRPYMTFRRTQPAITGSNAFAYENEVTAWWDASQIYGSDQFTQDRLRARDGLTWIKLLEVDRHARKEARRLPSGCAVTDLDAGGKLYVEKDGQPPIDPTSGLIDSGFTRNMWVGLELLHTLFVRHHNYLCDCYARENPQWKSDEIFHHARLENAATMAKIHTIEWTPAVLPMPELSLGMNSNWHGMIESTLHRTWDDRRPLRLFEVTHPYVGGIIGGELNNYGVPQNFSEQFVETYRLHAAMPDSIQVRPIGATTVADEIATERTRAAGSRAAIDHLVATYGERGLSTLVHSCGQQHMNALVNNNYPRWMTDMSTEGTPMFDIAAADVVRPRERGIPRFNEFRRQLGMPAMTSFDDLTNDPATLGKLRTLYRYAGESNDAGAIERLDVVVGMLCDHSRPLQGFDNTRFAVFLQAASRRLQTDPFFTEKYNARYYTPAGIERLNTVTMKKLLLRHFPGLEDSGLKNIHNAFEPWGTTPQSNPEQHPLSAIERYRT